MASSYQGELNPDPLPVHSFPANVSLSTSHKLTEPLTLYKTRTLPARAQPTLRTSPKVGNTRTI
jgi:hypothetical protein